MKRGRHFAREIRTSLFFTLAFISLAFPGCESDSPTRGLTDPRKSDSSVNANPVHVDIDARRPAIMLSEYRLFSNLENQVPNAGVYPYALNTSHFIDHATIHHYLYLPPGSQATYQEKNPFIFPVGAVLIQTLGFPFDLRNPQQREQIVETRLLIHQRKGWLAIAYLWNDEGTDARRAVIGGKTKIRQIFHDGSERSHRYITPDMNQCKRCHKSRGNVHPIGIRTRNLNRPLTEGSDNQLARWVEMGLLNQLPEEIDQLPKAAVWNDPSTASLNARARTWLDVNCAHCHNPQGAASVSGLDLSVDQKMPVKFGVYKPPVAAGRGSSGYQFSIDPGSPQTSFLLHRIRSTDPGVMMPTVGRSLVDEKGSALIETWIGQMQSDEQLARRALNPVDAYHEALQGGDADRGKSLFYSTAKCSSCHRAAQTLEGKPGKPYRDDRNPLIGDVGPSLADIGARVKREYLLESILSPSAKIVEKYATTIIQLEDGLSHTGIITSEDANELILKKADATRLKLRKVEITDRSISPVSIMPSMANILSIQEVADLIEFLSLLKVETSRKDDH